LILSPLQLHSFHRAAGEGVLRTFEFLLLTFQYEASCLIPIAVSTSKLTALSARTGIDRAEANDEDGPGVLDIQSDSTPDRSSIHLTNPLFYSFLLIEAALVLADD
jgi:hypothetical protein